MANTRAQHCEAGSDVAHGRRIKAEISHSRVLHRLREGREQPPVSPDRIDDDIGFLFGFLSGGLLRQPSRGDEPGAALGERLEDGLCGKRRQAQQVFLLGRQRGISEIFEALQFQIGFAGQRRAGDAGPALGAGQNLGHRLGGVRGRARLGDGGEIKAHLCGEVALGRDEVAAPANAKARFFPDFPDRVCESLALSFREGGFCLDIAGYRLGPGVAFAGRTASRQLPCLIDVWGNRA